MQDAKEEVRSRLNIEDVVGEYVQLKRAGRNFKGLSPFTSEKTASFVVSPEKHIWHDFSSGKGGDIFSFVMEVEGLDFRAALEQLARKAGVDLSMYDSKQSGEIARKKGRLLEASELAAHYYQQSLVKNQHALEYVFKKRGLSKDIVTEFRIGYAPTSGEALVDALTKKGFTKKELADAGLTNRYGGDIFRGRMTVPLMDASGQVIGFTGRVLVDDDPKSPKYLNTPQTLLYDKSRHVFGLSQAKESIRKNDAAVIVEGNLDVISSHQASVKNVVATAGTALTEWQLKALSRLSQNVKLAFDADKAGLAATERAVPIAARVDVELAIVSMPVGIKDPDELIQQDASLWKKAIDGAEPVVDWVLEQYSRIEDMASAAGKRRFTTASLNVVRGLKDAVEVEHYVKKIAAMTDSSHETVMAKLEQNEPSQSAAPKKHVKHPAESAREEIHAYEDDLLAVLLVTPSARNLLQSVGDDAFHEPKRQGLAKYLRDNPDGNLLEDIPKQLLSNEIYVKIVQLRAETRYDGWPESDCSLEAARLLRNLEIENKKQQTNILIDELRDAEATGDEKKATSLRTRLSELIKETAHGQG